jgi:hypothetical protein
MTDHLGSAPLIEKTSRDLQERLGYLRSERLIKPLQMIISGLSFTWRSRAPSCEIDQCRESEERERRLLFIIEPDRETRELCCESYEMRL